MWLPLFPLNTVLFPGLPLDLHIFEDRYKEMIGRCLKESLPFGVVLIREGQEALGPAAVPADVGTMAMITKVMELPGGRLFLNSVGRERFRIKSLDHSHAYLSGQVEEFDLLNDGPSGSVLVETREELLSLADEYFSVLTNEPGKRLPDPIRAYPPEQLAHAVCDLLQVSMPRKQELLEIPSLELLLTALLTAYRREIPVLRGLRDQKMDGPGDAASWN